VAPLRRVGRGSYRPGHPGARPHPSPAADHSEVDLRLWAAI